MSPKRDPEVRPNHSTYRQDSQLLRDIIVPYHVATRPSAFVCRRWVECTPQEMVCAVAVLLQGDVAELLTLHNMFLVMLPIDARFKSLRVWHIGQSLAQAALG